MLTLDTGKSRLKNRIEQKQRSLVMLVATSTRECHSVSVMPPPHSNGDACQHEIGCALIQTHPDGVRYPVGFWSRSLNQAVRNYSVSEKEYLAVVWAIQLLRPYIERTTFEVYTDHQPLRWLLTISEPSGRLARWILLLLEFDFTVRYKKGIKNTIADAISLLLTFGGSSVDVNPDIPSFLSITHLIQSKKKRVAWVFSMPTLVLQQRWTPNIKQASIIINRASNK